ncbi:MAG TPA: alpha/beta hydrolase [Cyanobacteria bacterium UBA11149]|nr:alpha/beta hydrolase [Cyanobacteria bacterium UBA11367]HBE60049.1 alpha/beta hydrolase [Cyanobacteria bacterium UBA11366]HBK62963.1 alpha/beta hydrolase [Cyanobacteria bacterium UBA11166]HBR75128.1 alpha/beta hydrolase [Cyanobacteria bacterium UBA11159]HBS68727.1 alpha/beta hydrolase [Cyanobacteria bacterium UBA11153]HBW91515.1 alpha/beta hydrolase [Cyanobacteria bacterium UBA11149]HCA96522.1 alpha/beta hydrolase [Cyanobacteria bacterium UBA9226]
MPYIEIRGVEHYYEWIRESQSIKEKPVIVFIHGWGGSSRYWESTAQALSSEFDCLLYDMRGFGRSRLSSKSGENLYEMEDYADDLAVLLDKLAIARVYIKAHSMGASAATIFLNRYRHRVERAILTCSGIFEYDEKAFAAFHQFGAYVVKFRPQWLLHIPFAPPLFMARFLHRPLPLSVSKAFLEDFLAADYEAALGTMLRVVSKYAAEVMPQEFAQLSVPTLLVSGEKDKIIPANLGRKAAQLSQNVKYLEIPQTAHFPMLEAPEIYLNEVREFLGVGVGARG